MLYLHKILPCLLMPLTWAGILLLWGAWKKNRWLLFLALLCLWLPSLGLISKPLIRLAEHHAVRVNLHELLPAQAIVVLSGMRTFAPAASGSGQPLIAEWNGAIDRLMAGVALWKNGQAPWFILTSGQLPWESAWPESRDLRELAIAWGVSSDHILITEQVKNTQEEAHAVVKVLASLKEPAFPVFSLSPMGQDKPPSVLLVTSALHLPRAQLEFQAAGLSVTPFPVDFGVDASHRPSILDWLPSATALANSHQALRELYGYGYVLAREWFYQAAKRKPPMRHAP
jgi:uncharacterized SAM-binding protein YcdF (DUF218 family)